MGRCSLTSWGTASVLALEEAPGAATAAARVEPTAQGLRHLFASALIDGGVGQAGAGRPGTLVLGHHAADVDAPVAGRRGPRPRRVRRRSQSTCGLSAD